MGKVKSDMTKIKIRTLLKAYCVMNRNRPIKSTEVSNWINDNHFGLKTKVDARYIGRLVKAEHKGDGILKDISIVSQRPVIFGLMD